MDLERIDFKFTDQDLAYAAAQHGDISLDLPHPETTYSHLVHEAFNRLAPFLPLRGQETPLYVMDWGCGLGGINAYLHRFYEGQAHMVLVDGKKLEEDQPPGGYRARTRFSMNVEHASDFLQRHGVPETALSTWALEAGETSVPKGTDFQLVLSLHSWGYHYPVFPLVQAVAARMAYNGALILDIKDRTDGKEDLRARFHGLCDITHNGNWGYTRVVGFRR